MSSTDKLFLGLGLMAMLTIASMSAAAAWVRVATKDSITAPECSTLCAPHPVASLDTKNCVCGSQPKTEVQP